MSSTSVALKSGSQGSRLLARGSFLKSLQTSVLQVGSEESIEHSYLLSQYFSPFAAIQPSSSLGPFLAIEFFGTISNVMGLNSGSHGWVVVSVAFFFQSLHTSF